MLNKLAPVNKKAKWPLHVLGYLVSHVVRWYDDFEAGKTDDIILLQTDSAMRCHWLLLGAVLLLGAIDVTSSLQVRKLARANGNFAFALYNKVIVGADGENVFFSPFSISTALAMTYAGARGKTAKEMCQVLRFGPVKSNVHATFCATLASLNFAQNQYTLRLANGVFVDRGFNMRPTYKNLLANYYSAGFKELEFHEKPDLAAEYINKWVKDRTNGKITKIVDASLIQDSDLALVNAIYFKGRWKCPFNPRRTKKATFHISPSETTVVNMMIQTARFRYSFNRRLDCQILELPYCGDRLVMDILLPKKIDGLAELESKLTYTRITSALARLRTRRRSVAIPRFEMTFDKDLPDALKAMGMMLPFSYGGRLQRHQPKTSPVYK
ncbi:Serpin family protein [Lamellibrachia satsuma]|nr:Serpin family protein [Lamellibrachia satsuma]